MLFIATVVRCSQSHSISCVAFSASPVLNRMFNMGMSVMNEKIFSMAESILNTIDNTKYFL